MSAVTDEDRAKIDAEIELARSFWPDRVAKIMVRTGDTRRNGLRTVRKAAVEHAASSKLKALGSNCGNCIHIDSRLVHGKTVCSIDGDSWTGYAVVKPSDVCSKHEAAQ